LSAAGARFATPPPPTGVTLASTAVSPLAGTQPLNVLSSMGPSLADLQSLQLSGLAGQKLAYGGLMANMGFG